MGGLRPPTDGIHSNTQPIDKLLSRRRRSPPAPGVKLQRRLAPRLAVKRKNGWESRHSVSLLSVSYERRVELIDIDNLKSLVYINVPTKLELFSNG